MKKSYFDLEVYGILYKKITHNLLKDLWLYSFDYKDIKEFKKKFNEEHNVKDIYGIYLIRIDDIESEIYIGQTTKGIERLTTTHNFIDEKISNNDDTNLKIFFISLPRKDLMTKNHLDFLEKKIIEKVEQLIYKLGNSNLGNGINLSEKEKKFVESLINFIYELLESVDINFTKLITKVSENEIFYYNDAKVIKINDKWKLLKGSKIKTKLVESEDNPQYINKMIKAYSNIIDSNGTLLEDIIVNSISSISAFISGYKASNGWISFKNSNDLTLDEVYRGGSISKTNSSYFQENLNEDKNEILEFLKFEAFKFNKNLDGEQKKFYYRIYDKKIILIFWQLY